MLKEEEESQVPEPEKLAQEEDESYGKEGKRQDETKCQTLEETQSFLTQEKRHAQIQRSYEVTSQALEETKGKEQGETKVLTQEAQSHDEKQNCAQDAHSRSQQFDEKQNMVQEIHSQSEEHEEKQEAPLQSKNEEKQNHAQETHSQSQDEENIKLLSVSVTFKSQPKTGECCVSGDDSESSHDASLQTLDKEKDDEEGSDVGSKQLTAPPVTPSLDCVTPNLSCVTYEDHQTLDRIPEAVSPGWKGFSNNIYIQPIIVRNVNDKSIRDKNVTFENNSSSSVNERTKTDLLRKQMRLRQSSHWINMHNERFKNVGSLKINEESSVSTKMAKVSPSEAGKSNLYYVRKKIRKGFVCRSWSADFLPNENKSTDEVENSNPLMVSRFVDRLRKHEEASTDVKDRGLRKTGKKTRELECENNNNVENFERDRKICDCQRTDKSLIINKSVAIEAVCNSVNSKENSETKPNTVHETHSEPKPPSKSALKHMLHCSGTEVTMTRGVVLSLRTYRPKGLRKNGVRFHSAVPIKNFPPINPLDGVWDHRRNIQASETSKKKGSLSSRRYETTPSTRPHTIETAFIGRPLTRNNKLVQKSSEYNMYSAQAQQKYNFSFHQTDMEERDCQLFVPRGSPRDVTRGYTPYDNRFQTCNDAAQHLRSYSEPPRSFASPDYCQTLNQKNTHAHPHRRMSGKNRTPVPQDDDDYDDSVSGLGSEVEYSNNGPTKLDIYLNPRVSNQDIFKT